MERKYFKAINFDLDTNRLKENYPRYQMAYSDLLKFFKQRDFSHRQGSGYVSNKKLISADIVDLISEMIDSFPWCSTCIKKIDKEIDSFKESADIPKQKFDKDQQFIKSQIKEFDPAMLNTFSAEFAGILKDIKDEYGIDEDTRAKTALQNAKITEISSSALNKLKGKPFTSEMVAEMLASRMKEERVFGKNPEAYKLLKQLYMMVF